MNTCSMLEIPLGIDPDKCLIPPASIADLTPRAQDDIDLSQATPNPDILALRGSLVGEKPPGYLSEGDWIVLKNNSKPFNGEPIHNPHDCPRCG